MEFLYESFRDRSFCVFDDEIDALKMIDCLYNVVHFEGSAADPDGVRFKNVTGLVVRLTASFDMIGIVCEFDLDFMIDAARNFCASFCRKPFQKSWRQRGLVIRSFGLLRVFGDIPSLSR